MDVLEGAIAAAVPVGGTAASIDTTTATARHQLTNRYLLHVLVAAWLHQVPDKVGHQNCHQRALEQAAKDVTPVVLVVGDAAHAGVEDEVKECRLVEVLHQRQVGGPHSQVQVQHQVDKADGSEGGVAGHKGQADVLHLATAHAEVVLEAGVLGDVGVRVLAVAETVHHEAVGQLRPTEVDEVRPQTADAVLAHVSQELRGGGRKSQRNQL